MQCYVFSAGTLSQLHASCMLYHASLLDDSESNLRLALVSKPISFGCNVGSPPCFALLACHVRLAMTRKGVFGNLSGLLVISFACISHADTSL